MLVFFLFKKKFSVCIATLNIMVWGLVGERVPVLGWKGVALTNVY